MTSSEATNVAKRQAAGGVSIDTVQHAAMFTWSKGHATVRDLVARRLVPIPTIVRISAGFRCEGQPHRFYFREGTVSDDIEYLFH